MARRGVRGQKKLEGESKLVVECVCLCVCAYVCAYVIVGMCSMRLYLGTCFFFFPLPFLSLLSLLTTNFSKTMIPSLPFY